MLSTYLRVVLQWSKLAHQCWAVDNISPRIVLSGKFNFLTDSSRFLGGLPSLHFGDKGLGIGQVGIRLDVVLS
jgi:hypothetical protein